MAECLSAVTVSYLWIVWPHRNYFAAGWAYARAVDVTLIGVSPLDAGECLSQVFLHGIQDMCIVPSLGELRVISDNAFY